MSLSVTITHKGKDVRMSLSGILDENCQLPEFSEPILGKLEIVLEDLKMINSLGCRKWAIWLRDRVKAKDGIQLLKCSPAIVSQISILEGFVPAGVTVESFFVPYFCEACSHEERVLLLSGQDFKLGHPVKVPDEIPCPKCSQPMELEVVPEKYLRYFQVA